MPREKQIDDFIRDHMHKLCELVTQDVEWMEQQPDLNDYIWHVTEADMALERHAEQMLALRERVLKQIANKCGRDGHDVYDRELANIDRQPQKHRLAQRCEPVQHNR